MLLIAGRLESPSLVTVFILLLPRWFCDWSIHCTAIMLDIVQRLSGVGCAPVFRDWLSLYWKKYLYLFLIFVAAVGFEPETLLTLNFYIISVV
jgi:hypothetical protein